MPVTIDKLLGGPLLHKHMGEDVVGGTIGPVDAIQLNTIYSPTGSEPVGSVYWNSVNGTLNIVLNNGSVLDMGQEMYFYGKASGAIANGDLVQFAGVQGDHILMKKAVNTEVVTNPSYFIGVAKQNISNGTFGYVTLFGYVDNVYTKTPANQDDADWLANDILYFSNTTGQLTKTAPQAPEVRIQIAAVVREQTGASETGKLIVRPHLGQKLVDLDDVNGTAPTITGQVLAYDSVNGYWDVSNIVNDHINNTSNPHSVTASQLGAVTTDQTVGQTIGTTGARLTKLWATDITVTNAISGSITGNSATVTTNANLTGPITSVGNATSIASQTGTGTKFVMDTSPTLVTPVLGVATATSIAVPTLTTSSGALGITPASGSNLNITLATTGDFVVNTDQLYVDTSAGFVGIGTTSPTGKLEVQGGASVFRYDTNQTAPNIFTILNLDNTASTLHGAGFTFYLAQTGQTTALPSAKIVSGKEIEWTTTGSTNDSYLSFETKINGTLAEKMRIDSSGNVGIGTTAPGKKLQVNVDTSDTSDRVALMLRNTNAHNQVRLQLSVLGDAATTVNSGMQLFHTTDSSSGAGWANYEARPLSFWTGTSAGSASQRLTITTEGNVGIGTTAPSKKLDVTFADDTLNAGAVFQNSDGSVLIGNVTGTANAFAPGIVGISAGSAGTFVIKEQVPVADDTGTAPLIRIVAQQTDSTDIDTRPILNIRNNATDLVTVDKSGKVGIGTTSPTSLLSLGSNAVISRGTSDGADNDVLKLAGGGLASDTRGAVIQLFGNEHATTPGNLYLQAGNSGGYKNVLLNPSGGNVGIGTSSPLRPLSVANSSPEAHIFAGRTATNGNLGNTAAGGKISFGSTSTATGVGYEGARIGMTAAETWTVGSAQGSHLVFENTAVGSATLTERMRITSTGAVGIGTVSPTEKLDINSDAIRIRTAQTPASAGAAGNQGDICWDSSYIYICIATNTWRRAAHSTW